MSQEVDGALVERIEAMLDGRVVGSRRVGGGYTPADRAVVALADGRTAFIKAAVDELTAGWLAREWELYEAVRGPFQPSVLAWYPGPPPILVLEDLSSWHWPPPWRSGDVEAVLTALDRVHATPPPRGLPTAAAMFCAPSGWSAVGADPEPFLALGLCSVGWLDRTLPDLTAAEDSAPIDGGALLHLDVRSDNLCIAGARVVLVDWNLASTGDPRVDVAFWLPSLRAEGGPRPEDVLPSEPELAALVAGFFAARAGRPAIPTAPRVRDIQLAQLRTALPWAVRALGLEPIRPPG